MFEKILKYYYKRFGTDKEYYKILDNLFGLYPNNIDLYKLALIHRSASVILDDGTTMNNERLEFLGDAILESIVSDYLFIEYPEASEGFMTKMRSRIVNRVTLNALCVDIGLDRYVIYQSNVSYTQKHIWGDAFEAIMGAIYLDKGYDYVNRLFINELIPKYIDVEEMSHTENDYKSRIIEWAQKSRRIILFKTRYADCSTSKNPLFHSIIHIDGLEIGYGDGSSKKEAEQNAALSVSAMMMDDEIGGNLLDMVDLTSPEDTGSTDKSGNHDIDGQGDKS